MNVRMSCIMISGSNRPDQLQEQRPCQRQSRTFEAPAGACQLTPAGQLPSPTGLLQSSNAGWHLSVGSPTNMNVYWNLDTAKPVSCVGYLKPLIL